MDANNPLVEVRWSGAIGTRSWLQFPQWLVDSLEDVDDAIQISGRTFETLVEEGFNSESVDLYGFITEVVSDRSVTTSAAARARIQSELLRLSQGAEVLKLSVLVDTTPNRILVI